MWAGGRSRYEMGYCALCSCFLHLASPSCFWVPLLCSVHFCVQHPQNSLCFSGYSLLLVLSLRKRRDLQVWEAWGWPVWCSILLLYHLRCSPSLLLCFMSIQRFCRPCLDSSGWTPRDRGFWLGTLPEICKVELMKPFTAVRCEDKWSCVHGLLDCCSGECHVMILHSIQDFVLQVMWRFCGIIKRKRSLFKSCAGEFNSGISLKLFLTCL